MTLGLFRGSMLLRESMGLAHGKMGLSDFVLESMRGLRGALLGYIGTMTNVAFFVANDLITTLPLTFDLGAWWAAPTWIVMATALGLAAWSFRVALAGRAAFRDTVLED